MALRPVEVENQVHINEIQQMAMQHISFDQYEKDTRTVWIAVAIGMGIIAILASLILLTIIS